MLEKLFLFTTGGKKNFSAINYQALVCSVNFCKNLDDEGQQHQRRRSARTPRHRGVTVSAAELPQDSRFVRQCGGPRRSEGGGQASFLSHLYLEAHKCIDRLVHTFKRDFFFQPFHSHSSDMQKTTGNQSVHELPNFTPSVQFRACPTKALEKVISRTGIHTILTGH